MKAKKRVTASVALVLAAVLLALTGTFAWQSISQPAKNEMLVTVNPGGRLHDDFDGENKDVYVENFTDSEKDGVPIYARVRLDEYMEIGAGAGKTQEELGGTQKRAESVVKGAEFDDVSTWTTYVPGVDSVFDTYRDLTHDGGKTVYLPTFNMNKDSLAADINGTYDGTDPDDDEHYDDYKTYTVDQEVTGDEVWDKDDNDIDEVALGTAEEGVNIETKTNQEHTAKETIDGTVITMADWLKNPVKGDFWVWDEDGWAYWANPIQPGTATGLLLDGIAPKNGIANGDLYYAINVVGQFFTSGDAGWKESSGIYTDPDKKPTKNAEKLLDEIGVDIGKAFVTVTAANNAATVRQASSLQFTAEVKRGAVPVEGATVTWSLDKAVSGCSVSQDGVLTVGSSVPVGTEVTVKAVYTNDDGTQTEDTATVKVTQIGATITMSPTSVVVSKGSTRNFTATVRRNNSTISGAKVTWSVSDSRCSISSSGVLTVSSSVPSATTMTVTATYDDEGTPVSATARVTVDLPYADTIRSITPSSASTVTIDGVEFYVMAKNGKNALLLSKYLLEKRPFDESGSTTWRDSDLREYLNEQWLWNHSYLDEYAQNTTLKTATSSGSLITTTDKVFLLSIVDVFSNGLGQVTVSLEEYTYNNAKMTAPSGTSWFAYPPDSSDYGKWWTRSAHQNAEGMVMGVRNSAVASNDTPDSTDFYVRPALWIQYTI